MASTITIANVHAILEAFDPTHTLVHVARPGQGIVNDVYFLNTSRAGLVLKIFDDDAGAWKPQKEAALFALMRELDIPSPVVLVVDSSRDVVPFIYSLSQRVEGSVYSHVHASLSVEENSRLYGQLGDHLGALHSSTFAQCGDVQGKAGELVVGPAHELGNARGPFARWPDMHHEIVNARLRLIEGTGFEDLLPRIEDYFARNQDLIAGDITPRLLHMDLHRGNILVKDGRISGILDVEESIVGHNEYDLMRTELANFRGQPPGYERAFMHAYSQHLSLDEGYQMRKDFYDVSRTLAWIKSLILHGTAYSKGQAAQSHHAARDHLVALISGGLE